MMRYRRLARDGNTPVVVIEVFISKVKNRKTKKRGI